MKRIRHVTLNKKRHRVPIVFLFFIFSLIMLFSVMAYRMNKIQQLFENHSLIKSITPTNGAQNGSPGNTIVCSPTPQIFSQSFTLRNFSKNDLFFENEKYPAILTSVEDKHLIGFYCSDEYYLGNNRYESVNPKKPLTDTRLLSYLETITKKYNTPNKTVKHFFPSIQYCVREDGPILFFYRVGPCGGGCDGIQHIARMSQTGGIEFDNEIRPNVEGVPYFGCSLLAIVKPEYFPKDYTPQPNVFLRCQGEGHASVMRIDVSSNVYMIVKSCQYKSGESNPSYECWE